MEAPGPQLNFPTGQKNKVHHSYVWLSSLVALGAVVIVGVFSNIGDLVQLAALLGTQGFNVLLAVGMALLGLVLIYGVAVGLSALRYKNLSYVFDEGEFSLYAGIITKQRIHIPYARVQSVNHRQSLIQRLAGVCTVEIDTAGGASNKAVKVPYVLLGIGEAIRQDLFVRKAMQVRAAAVAGQASQGTVEAPGSALPVAAAGQAAQGTTAALGSVLPAAAVPGSANILDAASAELSLGDFRGVFDSSVPGMEPVSYERRLDNKELVLAALSNGNVLSGGIVTLVSLLAVAVAYFLLTTGPERFLVGLAVPAAVLFAVFVVIVSAATTALSFGNFSVRRRGSRIEVERGILQRDFSGIDVDRIQSIVVRQSLVRKLFGYCEVSVGRVSAVGQDTSQGTQAKLASGALVLHPFCKLDQVDGLLDSLLPECAERPQQHTFKGLPAVAFRRGLVRNIAVRNVLFWAAVAVAVMQVVFNVGFADRVVSRLDEGARIIQGANAACVALYVLYLLQAVVAAIDALWWKRGSGFALNRAFAAIRNDGLTTETIWLPRQKIQNAFTAANPFQRRAGVATIGAVTAAGGGTDTTLWDVADVDAAEWLSWLLPRTGASVLE